MLSSCAHRRRRRRNRLSFRVLGRCRLTLDPHPRADVPAIVILPAILCPARAPGVPPRGVSLWSTGVSSFVHENLHADRPVERASVGEVS